MIIKAQVCHKDNPDETWEERWVRETDLTRDEAEAEAKGIIDHFNNTLRSHEKPRKLISFEIESMGGKHCWEKTNLVTKVSGISSYDTYQCTLCGATGKRFGLAGDVSPNNKKDMLCGGKV